MSDPKRDERIAEQEAEDAAQEVGFLGGDEYDDWQEDELCGDAESALTSAGLGADESYGGGCERL